MEQYKKLKLVRIDYKYCDYLRKFDGKVSYNAGKKELRPFVGVLFEVNNIEYFAPLSSPKEKHKKMRDTVDFMKIKNGNLGAINFNNMIPVVNKTYEIIDLNKHSSKRSEEEYTKLLIKQYNWLNKNIDRVEKMAITLYNLYENNELDKKIKNRCCNFKLLESKAKLYKVSLK